MSPLGHLAGFGLVGAESRFSKWIIDLPLRREARLRGNFGPFHRGTLGGLRLSVTCDLTTCALGLYCLGLTSLVLDPFGRI